MLCAVCGCKNYNNKTNKLKKEDVSYFHFPTNDPKILNLWVKFCRRKKEFNINTSRICSDHFTPDDIERNLQVEMGFMSKKRLRRLKPGSIPTVFRVAEKKKDEKRQARIEARQNKIIVAELLNSSTIPSTLKSENIEEVKEVRPKVETPAEDEEECIETSLEHTTDPIDVSNCGNCVSLKMQIKELRLKIEEMEEKCDGLSRSETALRDKLIYIQSEQLNKIRVRKNAKKEEKPKEVKQQRFSKTDIAKAKAVYSVSTKAYLLMRKQGFSLPSERTLQRWARKKKLKGPSPEIEIPAVAKVEFEIDKVEDFSMDIDEQIGYLVEALE